MRRHLFRWARYAWRRHCTTLAAAPDPHGQFPAVPLDWYLREQPEPVIPEQRTHPPHRR